MSAADEAWLDWYAGFPELAPMNAEIGFKAGYETGYRRALEDGPHGIAHGSQEAYDVNGCRCEPCMAAAVDPRETKD